MAATRHTLTADLADLLDDALPVAANGKSEVHVYLKTNLPDSEALVDTSAGKVFLSGGAKEITHDNGVFSVDLISTDSTDINVTGLRYRIVASYVSPKGSGSNPAVAERLTWDSGEFELTADANLADDGLLDNITAPPSWRSTFISDMEAIRDDAAAIVGLPDEAAAQAYNIEHDPGVQAALSASIDQRVPVASTSAQGKVELATTTEAQAGTDTVRAITPAGAKAAIDTLGGAQFTPAVVLQGTGIDLTGATDCSTALKALITAGLTAGAKRFVGVHGATYKITATESQSFLTLTGTSGITFDLSNSTIDNSATSYGAGTITPIFKLDGCTATEILVGKYLGFTLASPSTEIGYKGPILVYAINGTKRTRIVAPDATNLRYGLMTGDYGDYTKGQCAGFDVKIRGSMIGYPVAAYYADDITLDIDVNGVHRAAYLGGVQGVRGNLRFRDQYIAPYALYFTNCITSGTDAAAQVAPPANPTTSRGCSDANLTITDKGSTVFNAAGALIGMGLERVDPTEHKNIKVNGYVVGTDTLSTKTGLFNLVSANAPGVWSRYADEFTSSIVFRDIEIGGVCDHSAQTTDGNTTTGDIYVRSVDQDNSAAYATLRNISITAKLRKGSGTHQPIYFQAPGLQGKATLAIDAAGAVDATVYTNGSATVDLSGAKLANVNAATGLDSGGSRVLLGPGADIASRTDGSAPQRCMIDGGQLAGAGVRRVVIDSYIDLTGASVSGNPTLPAGAKIVGWSGRVVTAITGPTSANWKVGVTGADDCFLQAGNVGNTVGTTFGVQHRNTGTALPDLPASSKLTLVTAIGSNFTAGRIHFVLIVDVVDVPTS